ncbi:hypothetical protein [Flavobacterium sp. UBA4197]|uniref:hypothetical protein n=1 Tax=Flavobacterium sp. UBA4197 TaxID=1946546 RepID=UPI00257E39DB|nr:hypothetical protein [Flavobacterium sp. UBA4197]
MKLKVSIFTSLLIFLLSGYVQSFALAGQGEYINYTTVKNIEQFQAAGISGSQSDVTNYALCYFEKLNNKTYSHHDHNDNENEENELAASKKIIASGALFTTLLCIQVPEIGSRDINKRLSFLDKHFSFLPSCKKYIVFRVIRI